MLFTRGRITRQAHVDIPEGTVEEEVGRQGFFGRYAHLYRSEPPVGWNRIEGPLRPRAIEAMAQAEVGTDYLALRVPLLFNGDCVLSTTIIDGPMPYHFRNADGDETLFVHAGEGRIETDFGPLDYELGDYLVVPRGTVYRFLPRSETRLLVIETAGEIALPDRGPLGQHALFDPALITVPTPDPKGSEDEREEWELRIKRLGELTSVFYPFNPINAVGWKGDLTVWQLNIRDIRPVHSERYHLPPTAHITFVARAVVIRSFLPRPLENGDPDALKVPFYHANVDYDEVLFYHDGEFFSREGIMPGMITFHPQGIHHGPQQGAIRAAAGKMRTNEKAVMVDTRHPLQMSEAFAKGEWKDYWKSWRTPPVGKRGGS